MEQSRSHRSHQRPAAQRGLTLSQLWGLTSLLAVFMILDLKRVRPNDFWWHLRAGELISAQGQIPHTDLFTFSQFGQPWVYQSWLAELAMAWLYRLGDLPLVIFAHTLIVGLAFWLLFRVVLRAARGDMRIAAVTLLAACLLNVENWDVRPQMFSFLFFALTLYLIERHRRGGSNRWLWVLPPVMLLWANTHGAFVFGLFLVVLYGLTLLFSRWKQKTLSQWRPLAAEVLPLGLSGAASFATPIGLGVIPYVLGFMQHDVTRTMNLEFMPSSVRTLSGAGLVGVGVVLALVLIQSGYRPDTFENLSGISFLLLAFYSRRMIPWLGFVAAPVLATGLLHLQGGIAKERRGSPRLNTLLAAGLIALGALTLPWLRPHLPLLPDVNRSYLLPENPVEATERLCLPGETPARVFAEMGYASYIEWACLEAQPFVDTRVEQFPSDQWMEYLALNAGQYNWQDILNAYDVTHLMLRFANQSTLIQAAGQSPCWEERYRNADGVLFARRFISECS